MKQIPSFIFLFIFILISFCFPVEGMDSHGELPSIVGENKRTQTVGNETLMEVALREGFGFENIANSNRDLDPWRPGEKAAIILPGETILPFGSRPGLMINLAELRLFHIFYSGQKTKVVAYPLGIGRAGRETPEGDYQVIVKKERPDWRVPEGLRELDPELPQIVPPGPKNPLGDYWLGLSAPGYGVHGTNRPLGVGRRVSYGCLRMYAQDIESLYRHVEPGTPVQVRYQPIKAAWDDNELLLEVHPDYLKRYEDPFQNALSVISQTGWPGDIDYSLVKKAVSQQRGVPEAVGILKSKPAETTSK